MAPKRGESLKLYLSATESSIGCLLAQDFDFQERAIFYLSRGLTDVEWRYPPIENFCLALYFACIKLRNYLVPVTTSIICKTDIIRYMLSLPIIRGRCAKWSLVMLEYDLVYVPQHAVKGQVLADFLAEHPSLDIEPEYGVEIRMVEASKWTLMFDGSRTKESSGIGVVLISPNNEKFKFAYKLMFACSNNQAEYEALIKGLIIGLEFNIKNIDIIGDSQLVVKQITNEYGCLDEKLQQYLEKVKKLLSKFHSYSLTHVTREQNQDADELAQLASYADMGKDIQQIVLIQKQFKSCLGEVPEINVIDVSDWRYELIQYLEDPSRNTPRKVKRHAMAYVVIDGELYKKSYDVLLRCVSVRESLEIMKEVHEGTCGAHQVGIKMKYLIRRHGYFWPSCLKDCITYAKGCKACQIHGPIQMVPASEYIPIVKPWPFRGWAIDIIGKVSPLSSKQHAFIIVATDYFTKWVEAVPLKSVDQQDLIRFVKDIIHRFGIPEAIHADNGSVFTGQLFREFADEYGFKIRYSTPYYAQSNGQAEATNKVIIQNIKKMIGKNPKDWHNKLTDVLWAYRTSPRTSTGISLYSLTYGHDAVLPMEIKVPSLRISSHRNMSPDEYNEAMVNEFDDLSTTRMRTLDKIEIEKKRVARAYNKRVKEKAFRNGDLVWKSVLPIRLKDPKWGKWSPSWEGPYVIEESVGRGAYRYKNMDGEVYSSPINGQFLKKYYPTMWELKGF